RSAAGAASGGDRGEGAVVGSFPDHRGWTVFHLPSNSGVTATVRWATNGGIRAGDGELMRDHRGPGARVVRSRAEAGRARAATTTTTGRSLCWRTGARWPAPAVTTTGPVVSSLLSKL